MAEYDYRCTECGYERHGSTSCSEKRDRMNLENIREKRKRILEDWLDGKSDTIDIKKQDKI